MHRPIGVALGVSTSFVFLFVLFGALLEKAGAGNYFIQLAFSLLGHYRGGPAMFLLWGGLADYVLDRGAELLFGVASFHGTDVAALAEPLSWLHHHHLAPEELRVRVNPDCGMAMDLIEAARIDRRAAMLAMPPLIKAYLRLGGFVGEGAWVDQAFNTTDVFLVMDTARMSAKHRDLYTRRRAAAE